MTDQTLKAALASAFRRCPVAETILHTLQFDHASFTQPIRVVADKQSLTATLETAQTVTFVRYPFAIQLPRVDDRGQPEVTITIDNVTREIGEQLQAAAVAGQAITVTYRPYLASDPSQPQMDPPLTLHVRRCELNAFQVVATCWWDDYLDRRFPGNVFTADDYPGLTA